MPNINKNIIKQAGAAVANATNKAAGLSASTPEPGSIISAIQLVNGGRAFGPAALAHFTESVRNKLLSLLVSMEPIQDFNGYGHPWPAGGGKNKWEFASEYSGNGSLATNLRFTNQIAAGTYVLSCKGTFASGGAVQFRFVYTDSTTKDELLGYNKSGNTYYQSVVFDSNVRAVSFIYSNNAGNSITDIQFEPGSTFSDYAPYSNICPITGRTGANAYISPTPNVADATTYAADWTTPAGTVYAGSADIVTGDIKAAPYYASYNGETLVGPWVSSMDVYDPDGTPTTGAQVVDLGGTMTEYHITGQDIITLVGDNYIWSDSGDVTITE